ncbi:MAG: hypothetical protein WC457_03245 [Patescibacteria group bacterium]
MYENLQNINLTKYLNECCGGQDWVNERWLRALDKFVGELSDENKDILKARINIIQSHLQTNDIINEIMIACAYHPRANFLSEGKTLSYDMFDKSVNLKIEVKSLNEGIDEQVRHESDSFVGQAPLLPESEENNEICGMRNAITKKCKDHIEKAIKQVDENGKIYFVYDYNLFTSKNIGTKHLPNYVNTRVSPLSQDDVKNIINNCWGDFQNHYANVKFKAIYFGDLRSEVGGTIFHDESM